MKCAILIPGFLPVPAVDGGAVEVLIEEIINGNEKFYRADIDLYTIYDERTSNYKYKNCNIISVKPNVLIKIYSLIYKVVHKFVGNGEGNSVNTLAYALAAKKIIKNKKYDYIIIENNMRIYELFKKYRNLVFHLHNDILTPDKPQYLCKEIIQTSNIVINVSKYLAKRMEQIEKNGNINVLYNCVDFNIFNCDKYSRMDVLNIKKKYGIKENNFIFVYTGRLNSQKGIIELIEAFKIINKKYKNTILFIVGASYFGKNIEKWHLKYKKDKFDIDIENSLNGMEGKIVFSGFLKHNDVPSALSIADCVVIPSKWEEPFGVVALEAMAMKKPIIATKSGGLVEPLNERCAILIDKNTNFVDNLCTAMESMINNGNAREKYAKNAFEHVHKHKEFDKNNYSNLFFDIILQNKKGGYDE